MISLGLTAADYALYVKSLSTHHSVKITVQILGLDHSYKGDLSAQLIDGQVSIDADAEITRSLSIQLRDPDHALQIDSSSPNDGALFYDRMIRVIYSVKSELLPRWVDVPVFCGPVTKMTRTADILNVECQGKESLTSPPVLAYEPHTYAKGWVRPQLVRAIMAYYGGETKFSFPAFTDKTPGPVALAADSNIWAVAKAVNGSFTTRHLFYDGRGVLVMRSTPRTSTYTFRTGAGGNVTSIPTVDYDIEAVRNVVIVDGAIPKGKKVPVRATAGLPRTHPLNHLNMGRAGRGRYLLEMLSDDNQKTYAQAKALAIATVNARATLAVDVKFEALVAPHLEENDIYTLKTPEFAVTAYYKQATIPLKAPAGTVGYLAKKSINKTRIRRR